VKDGLRLSAYEPPPPRLGALFRDRHEPLSKGREFGDRLFRLREPSCWHLVNIYTEELRSSRYIRPMNRPLPLIAGLLGVLFLAIAATYWFVPASGLPSFFPGFKAGSAHIAGKHALGSLIIALVLFTFAWVQIRRRTPGV
jgi:hypothetical protein